MASKRRRKKKKKKLSFPIFLANLACCCTKPNASIAARPRADQASLQEFPGFFASSEDNYESARLSLHTATPPRLSPRADHQDGKLTADTIRVVSPCRKITNSLAMAKESEDPYEDFKLSMLQMVFEKEIHSKSDLRELLHCFLQLNSPAHHDVISRAFADIWNDVISKKMNKDESRIGIVSCFKRT